MTLKEKIDQDLRSALKQGDSLRRLVLGMVKSTIHNKEIELGKKEEGLAEEEILAAVLAEAKKRKDAIQEFKKADRGDLAEKEEKELSILKEYLPEELGHEEIKDELKKVVLETGASSKQDLGRVMGEAMKRLKGRADGKVVKEELEKMLE